MRAHCNGIDRLCVIGRRVPPRVPNRVRASSAAPPDIRRISVHSSGTAAMVVAIALVLLVVGSVLFHVLSPWYFTPIASNWGMIDDTVHITFWVTGIVFVAVNLFMAWCVLRYRAARATRRCTSPRTRSSKAGSSSSRPWVWRRCSPRVSSYGPSSSTFPRTRRWSRSLGKQWYWAYRFPGDDGVLGTDDARFVSDKNPFGINPNDPARAGRRPDHEPGAPPADGQAVQGAACAPSTSCTISPCPSSGSRWTWCRGS